MYAKVCKKMQLKLDDINSPTQDILSTQHSALSTQHSALSTQHSALSTQHSALSTLILISVLSVAIPSISFASDLRKLTYQGRILKPDNSPVNATTQFKLQVTDTVGTCVVWEENITTAVSNGIFSLQIGSGSVVFDGGGTGKIDKIFAQGAAINCKGGAPSASITPSVNDDRNLAVSFNDGSGWQTIASQMPIKTVPYALSAGGIAGASVDLTGLADTYVLKYNAATNTWSPAANGAGAGVSSVTAGTGISLTGTASNPIVNLSTPVSAANGGTGVNSSAASNGQLLIGNGAGFSLANLSAGSGINITNSAGGITIAATGSGTVTSVTAAATAGNPITVGGSASAPTIDITASSSGVNGYLKGADWDTFNNKLGTVSASASLTNNKIWIGDGLNKAQEQALSQDISITNTGVATINKIQNKLVDSTSAVGGVLTWDVGTSTWKAKAFPNCTTAQTPYYNGVADAIQCQSIAAAWGSVSGKPTTLSGFGITDGIQNAGVGAGNVITSLQSGNTAGRPAFGIDGRIYIDTQAAAIYRDSGTAWVQVSGSGGGGTVTGVSSANADISVSVASPNPQLTLNSGTAGGAPDANKIAKLNASGQLPSAMIPTLNQNTTGTAANVTGIVAMANGGTGANLTAANGAIPYSSAGAMALLSPAGSAGYPMLSGGAGAPTWSTISLVSGNITMPAAGNISNASGAMTVSASTNLTVQSNTGSTTTVGNPVGASATVINGGAAGGAITLTPGTLGLTVTGFTSGFVKSNGSGVLSGGNALASGDVTAALGFTPLSSVDLSGAQATGTLAAARFPALTGDVTTSAGSLATTIANNAVTAAKMANGTITDTQVAAGAAIGWSKVSKAGAVASDVGAVANAGGTPSIQAGLDASKPAFGTAGRLYVATDTKKIYYDTGAAWLVISTTVGADISGNISGNAANVTGTVAIANGGTGATTQANAANAILPSQASNSGKYLTTDGTNASWATVSGGGGGITSCPGGWTMIGTAGRAATYCIETNQRGATDYFSAKNVCNNIDDATLGKAHLCNHNEWHTACVRGSGLSNMTNDYEWVADLYGATSAILAGGGGCSVLGGGDISYTNAYRCCLR